VSGSSDSSASSDAGIIDDDDPAAVRSLAREQDRARQCLDAAGVMIVALDADAKLVLLNRQGCEILGYEDAAIALRRED
jgi:PAS domain-containing protein